MYAHSSMRIVAGSRKLVIAIDRREKVFEITGLNTPDGSPLMYLGVRDL